VDRHAIVMLLDARDLAPAPYLDVERRRLLAQDRLRALLVDPAHAPFGIACRVGSEREDGEMAPGPVCLRPPLRAHRSHGCEGALFRLGERRAHTPALEHLSAQRSSP
jgi:hypothetical protein